MIHWGWRVGTLAFALALSQVAAAGHAQAAREPGPRESPGARRSRMDHARELLGRYYRKSVVRAGERRSAARFVARTVKESLKGKWRKQAGRITATILKEAERHELDPIFLMAVIESESGFDPTIRGDAGEIGLMQILPSTAAEVAQREGLRWRGRKTLQDPVMNIRIGAAHFSTLREQLGNHGRLYIAAYNMGSSNVRDAVERDVWPKDYVNRVMGHYVDYYERFQAPPSAARSTASKPEVAKAEKSRKKARKKPTSSKPETGGGAEGQSLEWMGDETPPLGEIDGKAAGKADAAADAPTPAPEGGSASDAGGA
jgi:soluble lytic murein transglycosylase